ncbi:MAG TPA: PadR family transcriptional regulator [Chloroflexia bacterium]|nr:PadR family transcriptional regulator [Chloroflexia bacterium]
MHHGFGGPPWHGGRRGGWFMQPPIWGFLQPCLLLLLSEGPMHGYSMIEELDRRQLLGAGVDVGNLYRTLRRMEAEGLVQSSFSEPGLGPKKRVYTITPPGQELLKMWANTLDERTRVINRFLREYHRITGSTAPDYLEPFPGEGENPI